MLDALEFWAYASHLPFLFPGHTLHRAALLAVFGRRFRLADRLFEAAAFRYRDGLAVPSLARLRTHQLIARAQALLSTDRRRALELAREIEMRLSRLDDLEDLAPPFALTPAADLRHRLPRDLRLVEGISRAA